MGNFFRDNDDLRFYIEEYVDWESIVDLVEYGYRDPEGASDLDDALETYRDLLDLVGGVVAEEIAPRAAAIDRAGVSFEDGEATGSDEFNAIFEQLRQLDVYGLTIPRALGGVNAPFVLYFAVLEIMARADVSVMSHFGFHGGIASALLGYSMKEGSTDFGDEPWELESTRFGAEIAEILRGDAWGAMDITEPDAGSDMAALRTKAEQDSDGQWLVTGEKIFITSGHGKYHLVIARTEEPKSGGLGLDGLSMFLVPTYGDEGGERIRYATVERVDQKLGHHGSVTASIRFDRSAAQLIGQRGEGFKYMLLLMNNARIGVGFESIGVCEAAQRMASAYAAERSSMGKSIDRHEMIRDYLDEMASQIIGLRAIAMKAAVHEEMAFRLELRTLFEKKKRGEARIEDEKRRRWHKRQARRITPVLKYIAAERAVEIARRALQIHGGNGYMTEYGAEKVLRDALVLPIYEGTSQIQALMAMKDTLSAILAEPQAFVRQLAQARWRSISSRDPIERRMARLEVSCLSAQQHLITRTATDKVRSLSSRPISQWPKRFLKNWDPKRDFSYAMLHAERLTLLLSDLLIAEALYEQCRSHPQRRDALVQHLESAEPRSRFLVDEITRNRRRRSENAEALGAA